MAGGQYRASVTKSLLEAAAQQLDAGCYAEIRGQLRGEVTDAVERSLNMDWLDATHQVAIDEVMREVLGDDGLVDFHRRFVEHSAPRLLGAFLKGVANVFGESPRAILRAMPKAWAFVTRDLGRVETRNLDGLDGGDNSVEVRYVDLPDCLRTPTFVLVTRGGQLGGLALIGMDGDVETDDAELGSGRVTHRLRLEH